MRIRHLMTSVVLLVGCSSTAPQPVRLTTNEATSLAQQLANQKAQSLYDCQPFQIAEPARFVDGKWVWHQSQGQGRGDLEAKVEFKADGADPKVTVKRLESIPKMPAGLR